MPDAFDSATGQFSQALDLSKLLTDWRADAGEEMCEGLAKKAECAF